MRAREEGRPEEQEDVYVYQVSNSLIYQCTLAGSSCEGATFQAAVLYKNVRPDISTKGNLFEFM